MPATNPADPTAPRARGAGRWQLRGAWSAAALLSALFIGAGVLLRLIHFASGRSLWLDEAMLSRNIVDRSFGELLAPLDYDQGAPIGFLLLEKLSVWLLGPTDYALRLLPLIGSIAALGLIWAVSRKVLSARAVPVAVGLFSLSAPLVYYAAEAKQYAVDVAVMLGLLLAALHLRDERYSKRFFILLSALGAVALWLSHPSVFVLGGIAAMVAARLIRGGGRTIALRATAMASAWAVSLAVLYWVSLRKLLVHDTLTGYWARGFLPLTGSVERTVDWLVSRGALLLHPVGFTKIGAAVAAVLLLVGIVRLARSERAWGLWLLLVPGVLALVASALELYPFHGRLVLFLAPIPMLLAAEGAASVRRPRWATPTLGAVLLASMAAGNIGHVPPRKEEVKPVLAHVADHRLPTDRVYAYYSTVHPLSLYADDYGLEGFVAGIKARQVPERYEADLRQFEPGARVWFVFTHDFRDEHAQMLDTLDRIGTRLDAVQATGAAGYLYRMN